MRVVWGVLLVGFGGCMGSRPLDTPAPPPPAVHLPVMPETPEAASSTLLRLAEGVRWRSVSVRCADSASGEVDVGSEDAIAVGAGCAVEAVLSDGRVVPVAVPAGAAELRCDAEGACAPVGAPPEPPPGEEGDPVVEPPSPEAGTPEEAVEGP